MLVGAKVCDLAEALLLFVCGLYVGILTSSLIKVILAHEINMKQLQSSCPHSVSS